MQNRDMYPLEIDGQETAWTKPTTTSSKNSIPIKKLAPSYRRYNNQQSEEVGMKEEQKNDALKLSLTKIG